MEPIRSSLLRVTKARRKLGHASPSSSSLAQFNIQEDSERLEGTHSSILGDAAPYSSSSSLLPSNIEGTVSSILGDAAPSSSSYWLVPSNVQEDIEKPEVPPNIQEDIEKLKGTRSRILDVLHDADKLEIIKVSVDRWLSDLWDVTCDIDDLLDKYQYKLHWPPVRETSSSHLSVPSIWDEIEEGIGKINKKFEDINKQREVFRLTEDDGRIRPATKSLPTSSLISPRREDIVGRESDTEELIALLLSDEHPANGYAPVIAVVGMGGLGKTTLAQLVYNDPRVANHFQLRGWVWESDQQFDVVELTRATIEAFTMDACTLTKLDPLQRSLIFLLVMQMSFSFSPAEQSMEKKKYTWDSMEKNIYTWDPMEKKKYTRSSMTREIQRRRFLLVLDDVWNEDPSYWERFQVPLTFGAKGSKILITTRSSKAAQVTQPLFTKSRHTLSPDDCLKLLTGFHRSALPDPGFYTIGKMIAEKCDGLPLAATALGWILKHNMNINFWSDILESPIWEIEDGPDRILAPLKLSYDHLPFYVKLCFLYSSVYPKGHQFDGHELARLFMAQSLIDPELLSDPEKRGLEYISRLSEASCFQQVKSFTGEVKCRLHDLMHDLAQYVLRKRNGSTIDPYMVLEPRAGRTFLSSWYPRNQVNNTEDIIARSDMLRVLDLRGVGTTRVPDDAIGVLCNLCYLNLSYTSIVSVPESVCHLYNLQTLNLAYCQELKELPQGIVFRGRSRQPLSMPVGIGKLTKLRTLDQFYVETKGRFAGLTELQSMQELRGELRLSGLQNLESVEEVSNAFLWYKELGVLILQWHSVKTINELQHSILMIFLNNLCSLTELQIEGYGHRAFPSFSENLFVGLARVEISNCPNIYSLPDLAAVRCLKYLRIHSLSSLKYVREGLYELENSSFNNLEELHFDELYGWGEWSGVTCERYPCLRRLVLRHCLVLRRDLDALLSFLGDSPSIRSIRIEGCPSLIELCKRERSTILRSFEECVLAEQTEYSKNEA